MAKSWTWLAKQWKWMRYTPLGLLPQVDALLSRYSGTSGVWSSLAKQSSGSSGGLFNLWDNSVGKNGLGGILNNISSAINQILKGGSMENLIKYWTHSGMTDEARETMDYQLANQQILNEQEYGRKIDFYEQYESPAAMVRQYKEAGLNPMLLAGSGAGASASGGVGSAGSAGTASPGSGDPVSLIASLANVMFRGKELEIRNYEAETHRMQSMDYMQYLRSLTGKTDVETEQLKDIYPQKKELLEQQTNYFYELCASEQGHQALMRAGVDVQEAQKALLLRQDAILAAQEKYAEKYFSAVAALEYYQSQIAKTTSKFESETLKKRIEGLNYTVSDMLFQAALKAKSFENFSQNNIREWLNTGSRVVSALGGVALGVSGLSSGAAAINQATSMAFARSVSPGQAVMAGGLLYPNMFSVQ
jgi:hypothetical protein